MPPPKKIPKKTKYFPKHYKNKPKYVILIMLE